MDEMSSSEAEEASESMMEDSEEMEEEEEEEDDYDPEPEPEEGLPSWAVPPWPEWDDGFVNTENWEENVSFEHSGRNPEIPMYDVLLPSISKGRSRPPPPTIPRSFRNPTALLATNFSLDPPGRVDGAREDG